MSDNRTSTNGCARSPRGISQRPAQPVSTLPAVRLLNPSGEKQNDKDDHEDADEPDATVTIPVPIAAEAATESTEQEDYENDNEDEAERHGGVLLNPARCLLELATDELQETCGVQTGL